MKRLSILLVFFLLLAGSAFAQTANKIRNGQLKYGGALSEGESIIGATGSVTISNKTIDGDDNTLQDVGITSLKTEAGQASNFISRDGSGAVIDTKAVPTGDVLGTSDTQTITNKTIGNTNSISGDAIDSSTVGEAFIDSAITRDTELTQSIATHAALTTTHGVSGDLVGTSDTQTLTNKSISGEQIDSGTVAEARIDAAIARDSEVTSSISTHAAIASDVHGLPQLTGDDVGKGIRVAAGGADYEFYTITSGEVMTQEVVTMTATSTITLSSINTASTVSKQKVSINGLEEPYSNFTRIDTTKLNWSVGDFTAGDVVIVTTYATP